MAMRWVFVGCLATAACDQVFDLQRETEPRCFPVLAADGDEDHDGILNDSDVCPRLTDEEPHDEDADGVPDVCDLCPQLAEAGADLDCDGLGAACDPDETTTHEHSFFGFGSMNGLTLSNATITGDTLNAPNPGHLNGFAYVMSPVPQAGEYELTARIIRSSNPPVRDFGYVALRLEQATAHYIVRVSGGYTTAQYGNFQIQVATTVGPDSTVSQIPIGPLPFDGIFTLRVAVTETTIDASLTGFVLATLHADVPALVGDVRFGVETYHDAGSAFVSEVGYLRRVALASE